MLIFHKNKIYQSRQAFTLLEVLLAFLLFSVVSMTLFSIFYNGTKLSRRAKEDLTSEMSAYWGFDALRRDLERYLPYDTSESYPGFKIFNGTSDAMQFLTLVQGEMTMVRYRFTSEDPDVVRSVNIGLRSKKNVTIQSGEVAGVTGVIVWVRETIPFLRFLEDQDTTPQTEVLVRGLSQPGQFLYRLVEESANVVWSEEWQSAKAPTAIRLQMEFISENEDDEVSVNENVEKTLIVPHGSKAP